MALLPSNNSVIDVKPEMASVIDVKPVNNSSIDLKPENALVSDPTTIYLLPAGIRTLLGGQWIPFAGLTYPQDITFSTGGGVRP